MILTKEFLSGILERKCEDCEGVLNASKAIERNFVRDLPWFCTDYVKNIEAVFRFIAREAGTNRSGERAIETNDWGAYTDYRRKCLWFSGGCGTGKTTMAAFIAVSLKGVQLYNAERLDFDYATMSNADFSEAYEELVSSQHAYPIIIDDIGSEQSRKRYGNAAFTLGLIERLYDQWAFNGSTCVVTTNLGFQQIQAMYGDRAASRIREMFDFVKFNGPDRRAGAGPVIVETAQNQENAPART